MRLNPALENLAAYKAAPPLEDIMAHYGLDHLIKLASNEYAEGPFPEVSEALIRALGGLNRYPDAASDRLRAALSKKTGIPESHFVFGNGSCELLMLLGQALLAPGDHFVYPEPSFVVYHSIGALREARMSAVPLCDQVVDLDVMLASIGPATRMVIVCNPNNPTGTIVTPGALKAFIEAVPADTVVVLDEAYIEFVSDGAAQDTLPWLHEHENLMVLRTFSKIYGLAGLRVGYGCAQPGLIAALDKVRQPFNVTTLAQVAAVESLRHPERLQARRRHVAEERARVAAALDALGIRYVPSEANFILLDVEGLPVPGKEVPQALLERGVMTRSGYAMGCPGWLRVTIGAREENDLFLQHLTQISGKGATP